MPSLEQLYAKSPLEQYGNLSLGVLMSMQPGEAGEYQTRQQEYNRQIDELNRRATEINPYIVEQQRLENQQKQYLMPTHQASGMKAQAEIDTPNFYQTQAQTAMNKSAVEGATARGQLPTAQEIAATQGQMTLDATQNAAVYQALNHPELANTDPQTAKTWVSQKMPKQADKINVLIDRLGVQGAAQAFAQQMERMALVDPKVIQDVYKLKNTPKTQGSLNQVELALMAAGGDPVKAMQLLIQQGNSSEAGVLQVARAYALAEGSKTVTTAHLDKARTQIQQFETSTKTQQLVIGPDGKPMYVEQTTKGGSGVTPPQEARSLSKGIPLKLPSGATLK